MDQHITKMPTKRHKLPKKMWIISNWLTILRLTIVISADSSRASPDIYKSIERNIIYNNVLYQVPFSNDNILAIFTSEPITIPVSKYSSSELLNTNWSYVIDSNHLQHSLHGNGRTAYNIMSWNCRKGIIQDKEEDTITFIDVKTLIQNDRPHILGIIECDIYGHNSDNNNNNRKTRFSTSEVHRKLHIDGYSIELPDSWAAHGVARIMVYVSDQVRAVRQLLPPTDSDLPSVTLDIGLGREKKTTVNVFYREFTGGVSRDNSLVSQTERYTRQIKQWQDISESRRDYVIIGDNNLCAKSWHDANYDADRRCLSNMVTDFMMEESAVQLVQDFTRSEL